MAFKVAYDCLNDKTSHINTIFASRHGEITNTVKMLHYISSKTPISPTTFSLSVHNTVIGLLSIARSDHSSSTAISAGEDTLFAALQEAVGHLSKYPTKPVLVICADEILPDDLSSFEKSSHKNHALALLFDPLCSKMQYIFEWDTLDDERNMFQPAIALANFLDSGNRQFCWNGSRNKWKITLHD
jgi:hypothetical protein